MALYGCNPWRFRSRRHGFTLIELLAVIILMAVMAAVIVPSFRGFYDRSEFRAQTRAVMDLFAYAHEKAITLDTTVTLSYDPQSATFSANYTPPTRSTDQPVSLANSETLESASGALLEPRTVHLDVLYSVANYSVGGNGQSTSTGHANNSNDLHFRGDGTVESAHFTLIGVGSDIAHLKLQQTTGRLTLDDQNGQP